MNNASILIPEITKKINAKISPNPTSRLKQVMASLNMAIKSFTNMQSHSRIAWCAAEEAIFYCPTMNSHRPKSQNTSKEQALIPEKEIRWPRCHVSLEKSSKNHKPLEKWAKPNLSPDVTPRPANFYGEYFRRICHVVEPDPPELFAVFSRHSGWPK